MKLQGKVLIFTLILFNVSCVSHPLIVAPLEQFEPPEWYRAIFHVVEKCSGVGFGNGFDALRFFTSDAIWYAKADWSSHGGAWIKPFDLVFRPESVGDVWLVKHELVHAIRQTNNHDHPAFKTCGARYRPQPTGV